MAEPGRLSGLDRQADGDADVVEGPILLIEDDHDIRETMVEAMADEGLSVVTAENGLDALSALREATPRPSLIVLDLMMPIMDGYEFLVEREKEPALAAIPLVVITAGHQVMRHRLGDAPVVWKPIDLSLFLGVLDELRERKGAPVPRAPGAPLGRSLAASEVDHQARKSA